jgi:hypothetical protein
MSQLSAAEQRITQLEGALKAFDDVYAETPAESRERFELARQQAQRVLSSRGEVERPSRRRPDAIKNEQQQRITQLEGALKAIVDQYETKYAALHPDHEQAWKDGYMSAWYDVTQQAQRVLSSRGEVERPSRRRPDA